MGAQFERTLIVAEDDAEVSYLEGCTAPSYDKNQVRRCCVHVGLGLAAGLDKQCLSGIALHSGLHALILSQLEP